MSVQESPRNFYLLHLKLSSLISNRGNSQNSDHFLSRFSLQKKTVLPSIQKLVRTDVFTCLASKVLKFELSETETWQVWPPEKSMEAFVVDSAKDRLTLVSVVYFSQLGRRLLSFLSEMKAFQSLLLVSMETIKSSLLTYNDTTKINDKFVM